jgi:hypothetical protein
VFSREFLHQLPNRVPLKIHPRESSLSIETSFYSNLPFTQKKSLTCTLTGHTLTNRADSSHLALCSTNGDLRYQSPPQLERFTDIASLKSSSPTHTLTAPAAPRNPLPKLQFPNHPLPPNLALYVEARRMGQRGRNSKRLLLLLQ